jgi:hypothetical protein
MPDAGITAIGGVEDMVFRAVGEHSMGFAVAEDATVFFVFVGIDEPGVRAREVFGGDDLADGIGVELDQVEGLFGKLVVAKII